jgi:serine protease Do
MGWPRALGSSIFIGLLAGNTLALSAGEGSLTARQASLKAAVQRVKPAVVLIKPVSPKGKGNVGRQPPPAALGAIVDPKGVVVTSLCHIKGWKSVEVLLSGGRSLPAAGVWSDPALDLAVIKVEDTRPLPHVAFGDSDKVQAGDFVVALSNPWRAATHESITITVGLIAGKGRGRENGEALFGVDTAIGTGCLPGPLISRHGQLIGMVVSRDLVPHGGSGAVPSNRVKERVSALMKKKK